MALKDFVSGGGDLKSNLTHDKAGVLATGECERDVVGPGEALAEKLHLGHSSHSAGVASSAGAGTTTGTGSMGDRIGQDVRQEERRL